MQRERGLAGGLGPVDLDDPAAGNAADPECDVEAERTGGDGLDLGDFTRVAQAHDRALSELFFDGREGELNGLLALGGGIGGGGLGLGFCHARDATLVQ